ncbi:MAG: CBS domain-containing protein [Desulfovibrio sp.]|nr:MAG: CBS domain-containing protein [Desulfovibrio sp.]
MLIRDWMSKEPITVSPETNILDAGKLMKDNKISRLPVVDETGRVMGIITDRDVKEASPSSATSLEIHELYYLLSEVKVGDTMVPDPYKVTPTETVERAAVLMNDKDISGLPVVDDDGKCVGVITESDIFNVFISITGVEHGGVQFAFDLPNEPGSLKTVIDDLRKVDARIVSILTYYDSPDENTRHVLIRIMPMERFRENEIVKELKEKYAMTYWARDNVHPIIG